MGYDKPIRWPRLYAAAAVAGAIAGLLVALGMFPATPAQVTAWIRGFDNEFVGLIATMASGAIIGLALTATAHLGVLWQLRRK
jgi:hypothetical protein